MKISIVGIVFLFGGIVMGAGSIYSVISPIPGESPFVIAAGFLFAAGLLIASRMMSIVDEADNYPWVHEPVDNRIDEMIRDISTKQRARNITEAITSAPELSISEAITPRQIADYADIDEL